MERAAVIPARLTAAHAALASAANSLADLCIAAELEATLEPRGPAALLRETAMVELAAVLGPAAAALVELRAAAREYAVVGPSDGFDDAHLIARLREAEREVARVAPLLARGGDALRALAEALAR